MSFEIRSLQIDDISEAIALVKDVFDQFEAPEYSQEGVDEFYKYITPKGMTERIKSNHFGLVAITDHKIVGMIEVRENSHVSLMFVDSSFHRQGIGKQLWKSALEKCRHSYPINLVFTVNSSPYAVPIYEKLGFQKAAPEQLVNGIRFFPMEYS